MKKTKLITVLLLLTIAISLLVGCSFSQSNNNTINLKVVTAIEPEYDNITVLGKFVIAEKGNQSAIYSYDGTTYKLIAPLGKYVVEKSYANYSVGNTLSVYTEEPDPTNYYGKGTTMGYNGLIDLNGKLVVPLHDKISEKGVFESNKYYDNSYYKLDDYSNHTTSFYDGDGNLVATTPNPNPMDDSIQIIKKDDQIISCRSPSIKSNDISANLFDKDGKKLLSTDYKYLKQFNDYFIAKAKDNSFGVIDSKGNIIIPFDYSLLNPSNEVDPNNTWLNARNKNSESIYLMNLQGEKLLENSGYSSSDMLPDGNIEVKKDRKLAVVTPDDKILIDFNNYRSIDVYKNQNTLYIYSIQDDNFNTQTLTRYDTSYNVIATINNIKPYVLNYENGQFISQDKMDNMGVIDELGKTIIPFNYQEIKALNESIYLAKKDNKYSFINSSTTNTILSGFDSVFFNKELIQATKNGTTYFYDYNCNQVNLEYDSSKIANFHLQDDTSNADLSKDNANRLWKNNEYFENQDGSKSMIVIIESDTGKKGVALIPSML